MIHFVLSIENQNYTKKQGALAIEQNVMKTLFLKIEKSLCIETVPFTSKTNIRKKTQKTNNLYILYIEHVTHIVKYKYRF
jgi:hypothetical protein